LNSLPLGARGMVWVVWGIITHGGRAKRTDRQAGRQAGRQADRLVSYVKPLKFCLSVRVSVHIKEITKHGAER
jgi:hypothetical protein